MPREVTSKIPVRVSESQCEGFTKPLVGSRACEQYANQMYVVIKTIKGRRYRYLQTSFREGKRVRTRSICLGPVDGIVASGPREVGVISDGFDAEQRSREDRMMASAERAAERIDKYQRETFGETAAERTERVRQEHLSNLYAAYGLRVSDTKAPEPAQVAVEQSSADAKESPSDDEGQAHSASEEQAAQNN